MSGTQQLREQLDALQASLRAFDAPVVDEHAGLRLMAERLREREEHIRRQIDDNETCTITLQLRDVARDGAVPAGIVGALLAAADTAVNVVAAAELVAWQPPPPATTVASAATLHLRDLQIEDDVRLTLARPLGPLPAQLAHPASGAPFAEHVMAAVTQHLAAAARDDLDDAPGGFSDVVQSLADLVVTAGTVLEWRLQPYVLAAQSVTIDQITAQRLLAAVS